MIRNQRQVKAAAKAAEGYLGREVSYPNGTYRFWSLAPTGWFGVTQDGTFRQFNDADEPIDLWTPERTRGRLADLAGFRDYQRPLFADTALSNSDLLLPGQRWLGHHVTWWRKAHAAAVVEHAVHRVLSLEEIAAGERPEPLS